MPSVRIYYDESSGEVHEIEHRPDESYDAENAVPGRAWFVAKEADVANVPFADLSVRKGKLVRTGKSKPHAASEIRRAEDDSLEVHAPPPDDATQRRVDEILQIDKSKLSDEDWLKLFREYMSLMGRF